jgi:hypothetical protein
VRDGARRTLERVGECHSLQEISLTIVEAGSDPVLMLERRDDAPLGPRAAGPRPKSKLRVWCSSAIQRAVAFEKATTTSRRIRVSME